MWLGFSAIEKKTGLTDLVPGSQGIVSGLLELQLQVIMNHCRWVVVRTELDLLE